MIMHLQVMGALLRARPISVGRIKVIMQGAIMISLDETLPRTLYFVAYHNGRNVLQVSKSEQHVTIAQVRMQGTRYPAKLHQPTEGRMAPFQLWQQERRM
jgi:hypothetical protein